MEAIFYTLGVDPGVKGSASLNWPLSSEVKVATSGMGDCEFCDAAGRVWVFGRQASGVLSKWNLVYEDALGNVFVTIKSKWFGQPLIFLGNDGFNLIYSKKSCDSVLRIDCEYFKCVLPYRRLVNPCKVRSESEQGLIWGVCVLHFFWYTMYW